MSEHDTKKMTYLKKNDTLNHQAARVKDDLFLVHEFFDPHDLVQVKYELLRKVSRENCSVTKAIDLFGVSRPYYYKLKAAFEQAGLSGLSPHKRGPKGAHKLTDEIVCFIDRVVESEPGVGNDHLSRQIEERFGTAIHARTIERYRKGQKKTGGDRSGD